MLITRLFFLFRFCDTECFLSKHMRKDTLRRSRDGQIGLMRARIRIRDFLKRGRGVSIQTGTVSQSKLRRMKSCSSERKMQKGSEIKIRVFMKELLLSVTCLVLLEFTLVQTFPLQCKKFKVRLPAECIQKSLINLRGKEERMEVFVLVFTDLTLPCGCGFSGVGMGEIDLCAALTVCVIG